MGLGGQFRSSVWDPSMICAQMLTMQCVYYVALGFWLMIVDYIAGVERSLSQIFSYEVVSFKEFHGRLVVTAIVLNALTGATGLWYIVRRTKQCLDFTATVHVIHFLICCFYNGGFPNTVSWWLVTTIAIVIMTVLGEFLCMRTELKAIPLSMAPKVDL